jgi:aspartate kinase
MVLQNISRSSQSTDITFTLPRKDGARAVAALTAARPEIGFGELIHDEEIGKVSLIGGGMRNHPGVTATFCEALSSAGVNIETMNTSEIRISVVCRVDQLDAAVKALHARSSWAGPSRPSCTRGPGDERGAGAVWPSWVPPERWVPR